jgi:citronellyl-CoA synthetase
MPPTPPRLKQLLGLATDLRRLATDQRDEVAIRARLLGNKLPSIAQGLRYIAKKDKGEILSIGRFIEQNALTRPEAAALLYEDRRYSHREFHEQSNRFANLLAARGVGKGDVVGVLVENRPELLFAVAGIVKLGAIAATINTRQRGRVLEHSFKVAKARAFVIGEELWDAFAEVRPALGQGGEAVAAERVLWLRDGGSAKVPASATDAEAALATAPATTPSQLAQVTLGDPCFYVYTSGTTGLPKASIMSHFRWAKAAGVFGHAAMALKADDTLYVPLPLYHNNALTVAWGSASSSGAAIALRRKFSVSHFWDDVRKFRATSFVYIGELCRYLLNQPARSDDRFHAVTRIVGNGLRPDIWRAFKERFGIDEIYEFYAASEGNIAFVNLLNLDCTVGFCPAKYALVKYDIDRDEPVRDAQGHLIPVARGEVGLLVAEVNERYAFDGYTDKAASEKKLFRNAFQPGDAWFNSGDLMRDQGFRHAQFVDRVGDTFRWKGENVSTNEVAEVVNGFPQIAETTVYGVTVPGADGRCGMAALVTRVPAEELDFAGLARHVRAQLPAYAVPVFLRVCPELEVTGTFKQVKSELKAQGFDLTKVGEPTYVLLPKAEAYVPLTAEVERKIRAGEISL